MDVAVNGASLYAELEGNGQDLVMMHGVGVSSSSVWKFVRPALSRRHRVLTYDLRGFDRSTDPTRQQTVARHTDDLVALMEHLKIGPAHVLGFSYTGFMAIQLALERPELVRSLILVGTSAGLPAHMRAVYEKRVQRVREGGMGSYGQYHSLEVFSPEFLKAHPDRAKWYCEQFVSTNKDTHAYTAALLSMMDVDFRDRVSSLHCPVLLLSGTHDKSPMNSGTKHLGETINLHRLIPQSELTIIPDAGHYMQIDQPDVFVRVISEFMERVRHAEDQ